MAGYSNYGSYNLYKEKFKQVFKAALQLCNIKSLTLDPETARQLEEEKLREKYISECSHPKYVGHLPPVHGLVGKYCSKPFKKQLAQSDLNRAQTRLLLKKRHVKEYLYPLLSSSEVEEIKKRGISVNVYDGEGNMYEMKFKLWGLKAYVLTTSEWLRFCGDHDLVEGKGWITVWMFKHAHIEDQLCFAIAPERMNGIGFAVIIAWLKKKIGLLFGCSSVWCSYS